MIIGIIVVMYLLIGSITLLILHKKGIDINGRTIKLDFLTTYDYLGNVIFWPKVVYSCYDFIKHLKYTEVYIEEEEH